MVILWYIYIHSWSYVDKPSRFPPSPTVKYTGAFRSFTGVQRPLVMLYLMLDTRICHAPKKITCQVTLNGNLGH